MCAVLVDARTIVDEDEVELVVAPPRALRGEGRTGGTLECLSVPATIAGSSALERAVGLGDVPRLRRTLPALSPERQHETPDEEQKEHATDGDQDHGERRHARKQSRAWAGPAPGALPTGLGEAPASRGRPRGGPEKDGGDLLSQALAGQVPSALRGLTSLFGMGRGVTLSLWPPKLDETERSWPGLENRTVGKWLLD